jgi:uncharacterized protein YjeT (DUF2065 family)
MTIWVSFLGVFAVFFGLLFAFAPKLLGKMSSEMNRTVKVDTQLMGNRRVVGAALMLLGVLLFYYAATIGG